MKSLIGKRGFKTLPRLLYASLGFTMLLKATNDFFMYITVFLNNESYYLGVRDDSHKYELEREGVKC